MYAPVIPWLWMHVDSTYLPKLFLLKMTLKVGRNSEHIAE